MTRRRWLHEAAFPVLEEGCSCSLCPHRQLVYRSRAAGSSGPGAPSRSRRRSSKRHPLCGGETRGAAQPPRTGKYVMVMGIVRSCSPEPVLRAIKMTDLSENPVHKDMWSLEVEDLHRVIP
ncbi:recQ-mediated genome instability protein 2 isoform X2 [Strigops habroptila]|uniref:recQ-mediated genome instability protein 2 isoform X2 n=1 Tax=Strigops habroptila TaxID=2489341 RepID=UPI0011CFFD25|nr:recQ-mediated genome instability protein 2 isoform X2 [Strigops habroptila]